MAVARYTQQDVGHYEAKFIGPFTAKETAIITPGIVLSALTGFLLYGMEIFDAITIFIICAIIFTPFVFFAKAKPYGMSAKEFIKMYYQYHILTPQKRVYKTETFDDVIYTQKDKTNKIPKHKKSKDYPDFL